MTFEEMKQELNKLTKTELICFCIDEVFARYCDNLNLKSKVELTLKHIKEQKRLKLNAEIDEVGKEMEETSKILKTQEYLDLEAKLKKLRTEPYTKTYYKDILNHNKKINKVLDAMETIKKPLATARRKYLDLCKKRWELYKC
jgi:hypothetical protein